MKWPDRAVIRWAISDRLPDRWTKSTGSGTPAALNPGQFGPTCGGGPGVMMLTVTQSAPGVGDLTSQVVASGAASFYVGPIPEEAPRTFGGLCSHVREHAQALCLGWRDPKSGHQTINPPDDTPVPDGVEVVYLAEEPRL